MSNEAYEVAFQRICRGQQPSQTEATSRAFNNLLRSELLASAIDSALKLPAIASEFNANWAKIFTKGKLYWVGSSRHSQLDTYATHPS